MEAKTVLQHFGYNQECASEANFKKKKHLLCSHSLHKMNPDKKSRFFFRVNWKTHSRSFQEFQILRDLAFFPNLLSQVKGSPSEKHSRYSVFSDNCFSLQICLFWASLLAKVHTGLLTRARASKSNYAI